MELGPRDVKNNQVVLVRRDNGQKITEKSDGLVQRMQGLLTEIQTDMFTKAKAGLDENVVIAHEWKDVVKALDQSKLFMAPFCGIEECEDEIKELSKADVEVRNSDFLSLSCPILCLLIFDYWETWLKLLVMLKHVQAC